MLLSNYFYHRLAVVVAVTVAQSTLLGQELINWRAALSVGVKLLSCQWWKRFDHTLF